MKKDHRGVILLALVLALLIAAILMIKDGSVPNPFG